MMPLASQRFLMFNPQSTELTPLEKELFQHPFCAGAIFFAENYEQPKQLMALMQTLMALNPDLLFAVDQEGGRVQRFRHGFTRLPAASELASHYQKDPRAACDYAFTTAKRAGDELKPFGFSLNFAPVLDLDYGIATVLAERSFGRETSQVIALARSYIKGMKAAGLNAVAKHFPGHGAVAADSHTADPIDLRRFETIWQQDVQPYRALLDDLPAIMASHVCYANCDKSMAGFSAFWLQQILRQRIGFRGAIISDDLTMKAAASIADPVARVAASLSSGVDLVLLCHAPQDVMQVLDDKALVALCSPAQQQRLAKLKKHG